MKSIKALASTALFAVLCCGVASAHESKPAAAPTAQKAATKALTAKLVYCQTCHGVEAQGVNGIVPIPRLAGQQPKYISNQLHDFIGKDRTNPIMSIVARGLTPSQVAFLAQQFKKFDPPPLGGAPADQVAAGKEIYDNGVPDAHVPPCQSCHGADAHGRGEIPRLAGQLNAYIVLKLKNWDRERGLNKAHPGVERIMKPIVHELTDQQKDEIAAYVSTLK